MRRFAVKTIDVQNGDLSRLIGTTKDFPDKMEEFLLTLRQGDRFIRFLNHCQDQDRFIQWKYHGYNREEGAIYVYK